MSNLYYKTLNDFYATRRFVLKNGIPMWPLYTSYAKWQKLIREYICSRRTKYHCKFPKRKYCKHHLLKKIHRLIASPHPVNTVVEHLNTAPSTCAKKEVKVELITLLKLFLDKKHLSQHIEETIPDHRNPESITYSKESIMLSALAIFLFRMGSGHQFDSKSHDPDEKYSKANIAKFINDSESRVPVIKTIEDFLSRLEENSINRLMIAFFQDLLHSKFFIDHPEINLGECFSLAVDGVHTHTYSHPHHLDHQGNNDCQYCLKRVYNKGTKKEYVRWIHQTLVFSFVFIKGLKIPIYSYPIHAHQVKHLEDASEETHKQECELVALKMALPRIREAFPRMKMVLLLDGLYANRPVIQLAEQYECGYIIVRKEKCLRSLARECDEQSETSNHKNCTKKLQSEYRGWEIKQRYEWFNARYLGEGVSTNVLRFWETRTKGKKIEKYQCEWLFSWRLSARNCEQATLQARSRWEIEDLFNTAKQRGYHLKHDYSRDPCSYTHWQAFALLAFGLFELFRFSQAVEKRGDYPQITLVSKLLCQLLERPTQEIFLEEILTIRVQFRYKFTSKFIVYDKAYQEEASKKSEIG